MEYIEIVAHRGIPEGVPENTLKAFEKAVKKSADAVEFDVRLTADKIPIIFHYFYLEELTNYSGPIFNFSFEEIQEAHFMGKSLKDPCNCTIPDLRSVLENFGGKIGLEIEIKGPEPESAEIIGEILNEYTHLLKSIEVTSYEPYLLRKIQKIIPGIKTDLLLPLSEDWMNEDVIAYVAIQRARIARSKSIHLHPTQLSKSIVNEIRNKGIQIHAWDINDTKSFNKAMNLDIKRICTDNCSKLFDFRKKYLKNKI